MFAGRLRAHIVKDMTHRERRDMASAIAATEGVYITEAQPRVRERDRLRRVHKYAHGSENVAISRKESVVKRLEQLTMLKNPNRYHLREMMHLEALIPTLNADITRAERDVAKSNSALHPDDRE